jgi:hypothetical protein
MILTGKTEVLGKYYTAWVVHEWMSVEQRWNDTDRGNWSTGRKTLYSVGGRWMDEYGATVEWYWQGKPEVIQVQIPPAPLCLRHQHVPDTEHSTFSQSSFSIHFCLVVCNLYWIFITRCCRFVLATLASALPTNYQHFKRRHRLNYRNSEKFYSL